MQGFSLSLVVTTHRIKLTPSLIRPGVYEIACIGRHGAAHQEIYPVRQKTTTGKNTGQDRAPCELLDVNQVAAMLCCSAKHVHRLRDAGKIPQPLKVGALVRWRRSDILDWIDRGCPAIRAKGGRR